MDTLGNRIKSRRLELNLSQEQLADRVGYKSRSTVNKIELGINDITQSKILAFAKALHTTPSYLMGYTDVPFSAEDMGDVYVPEEMWPEEDEQTRVENYLDFLKQQDRDATSTNLYINLKTAREKNNKSIEDLANDIGVNARTIKEWEQNLADPNIPNLIALSQALDVSIDELVGNIKEVKIGTATFGINKSKELTPEEIEVLKGVAELYKKNKD